jgi:CheY-like chemotaxis protein
MVTKEGDPIKVFLAEDDDDDIFLFAEALKDAHPNATLKTVEDGEKLMKYLATIDGNHPDIIFLDINMPCKDGRECLKAIRSNKELDEVPVIMFSTSNFEKDIDETFKNGASLYVSKPAFFKDEVTILKKIFSLNWQKDLLKPNKERFVVHAGKIF